MSPGSFFSYHGWNQAPVPLASNDQRCKLHHPPKRKSYAFYPQVLPKLVQHPEDPIALHASSIVSAHLNQFLGRDQTDRARESEGVEEL